MLRTRNDESDDIDSNGDWYYDDDNDTVDR